MTTFLISLAVLVGGYFVYGLLVEKVFGIDPARLTPAVKHPDGVDFVPLPTWKVFMIQFLNIAGVGPIFGAIMGVMFGPAAFLWIVFGTIFAGAVHDFTSAMLSLRQDGVSLPEVVGNELGVGARQVMRVFSVVLLVLVGAVFVITPSGLLASMTPDYMDVTFWAVVIFLYYLFATMLPIDKLIGKLYPLFGGALLFMAVALMGVMLFGGVGIPDGMADGLYNRHPQAETHALFPMLFISIACGALSGFHATQSPMMARCLKNEKHARPIFYGAMVTEGIVALIWAAAAITFTRGYTGLQEFLGSGSPAILVNDISEGWLGKFGGLLAILGVIAAPITSGDTALRSARLIAADFLGVKQKRIIKRLLISVPIFVLCFIIMLMPYDALWRYFAWCNQVLSVFTLWSVTVYLAKNRRLYIVSLVPALFMTAVTVTYIFFAPEGFGALTDSIWGVRIAYEWALAIGIGTSAVFLALFAKYIKGTEKTALA